MKKQIQTLKTVVQDLLYSHFLVFARLPVCLEQYFLTWLLIHRPETLALEVASETYSKKKWALICTIRIFLFAFMVRSVQNLVLMYPTIPEHWRCLLWDQIWFQDGMPKWNWIYFIIGTCPALNYARLYFYKSAHPQASRQTIWLVFNFYNNGDLRYVTGSKRERKLMDFDTGKIRMFTRALLNNLMVGNKYFGKFMIFWDHSCGNVI